MYSSIEHGLLAGAICIYILYTVYFKLCFSSQQVAEGWPLFFFCPPLTPGTPREFSQRDPRDMLLPGSGDISKPCLAHQLSLCSPGLNEESLLQHWDHVSKRNQFVGPMRRQGYADIYYVRGCGNRSPRSLDSGLWHEKGEDALIVPEPERFGLKEQQICSFHMGSYWWSQIAVI